MQPSFASGTILAWSGPIGNIPSGWVLCDGNNGTPDLRDKFVVAAGDSYAVDAVGGIQNHDHDFTGDTHSHNIVAGSGVAIADTELGEVTTENPAGGTTDAEFGTPYYSLAFIMEI